MSPSKKQTSDKKVYLRLADESDAKDIWDWRNDPEVRKASFNSEVIAFSEHKEWFAQKLRDKKNNIFIILNENFKKIGQIRFTRNDSFAEVHISLAKEFRGAGYGTMALKNACDLFLNNFDADYILAKIKRDNIGSVRAFEKAGFDHYKADDDHFEMVYRYKHE